MRRNDFYTVAFHLVPAGNNEHIDVAIKNLSSNEEVPLSRDHFEPDGKILLERWAIELTHTITLHSRY